PGPAPPAPPPPPPPGPPRFPHPTGPAPPWRPPHPAPPHPPGPPVYPSSAGRPNAYPTGAPPPPPNFHPQMSGVGSSHAAPHTQMSVSVTKPPEVGNLATKMFQALLPSRSGALRKPASAVTIGRATDNGIGIQHVPA